MYCAKMSTFTVYKIRFELYQYVCFQFQFFFSLKNLYIYNKYLIVTEITENHV